MNLSAPYLAVTDDSELEAVRVLARTTRPLTGRDVARLSHGRAQTSIQRALRRLAASGLVDAQEAGRAILYTLNRDHVAAAPVLSLLELREELLRRVAELIASWDVAPVHASAFGSAARGDGDEASDVDLFIVRPDRVDEDERAWREQLDELSERIRRWSGNEAAISEVSEKELRRLRRERPPVVAALSQEAVALAGPPAAELLRSRR